MDFSEVMELVESYEKQVRSLKNEALELSWHMRGGLSYEDAIMLGLEERKLINNIIKNHMETTSKTGLPYF